MKTIILNENEKAVYNACVAGIYGDTGCEFDKELLDEIKQLKERLNHAE